MYLDHPAVMPEIIRQADAVFASFGSSDDAFLDVVFDMAQPEGKLPFDLPSSMRAVANGRDDVPFGTEDPPSSDLVFDTPDSLVEPYISIIEYEIKTA